MNWIDLFVIAYVVIFSLFGLFGMKFWKRIVTWIATVLSLPLSYFIAGKLTSTFASQPASIIPFIKDPSDYTIVEYLIYKAKSVSIINELYEGSSSFKAFLDNTPEQFVKLLLFYVIGIVMFVLAAIVSAILCALLKKVLKPKNSLLTFGIPSLIKNAVVIIFILSPVFILKPVLNEVPSILKEVDKGGSIVSVVEEANSVINKSKVGEVFTKLADDEKIPFLSYTFNEDGEEKEYYLYSDMKDIAVMVSTGLKEFNIIKDSMDKIQNVDYDNVNSIGNAVEFIQLLKPALEEIDNMRGDFSEKGVTSGLLADILKYFLEEMPKSVSDSGNLALLKKIKAEDLAAINYKTDSIKDKFIPLLIQAFIDDMVEKQPNYEFLTSLNVKSMTFDQITDELVKMVDLIDFYKTFAQVSNIEEIQVEDIKNIVENLKDSQFAEVIIGELTDQLGFEVDVENLDFEQEAETIELALNIANGTETITDENIGEIIDTLTSSQLVMAVAAASGETNLIDVELTNAQYETVETTLANKVANNELTEEEKALILSMFNNGN